MQRMTHEHKAVMAVLAAAVMLLLYFGVSRQPTRHGSQSESSTDKHSSQSEISKRQPAWKSQSPVGKLLLETDLYAVYSHNYSLRHEDVPLRLGALVATPQAHIVPKLPSVLLLPPLEHSAAVFEQLGTLQLIAQTGHRAFAIDLPGSGNTRVQGRLSHAAFVQAALVALDADRPVLVAATSSGPYAFDFLFDDDTALNERLSGFIALSPTGAEAWTHEDWRSLKKIYTTLIYGGSDDSPGNMAAKRMQRVHTVQLLREPSAGHLHFMERPGLMHQAIIDALKDLED